MIYSPNCIYIETPDGSEIYYGSATTTETGERAFGMAAGVLVRSSADGSEAVAMVAGCRAIAKGLGARAVAYAKGSHAVSYGQGALAIPVGGKAEAFNEATVYHG